LREIQKGGGEMLPLIAMEPSSEAERDENTPWKAPRGVRAEPTMTMSKRKLK